MATTPTTSALGVVTDIGRSVATGRAATAASDDGSSNKSCFSTVLDEARDSVKEVEAGATPDSKPVVTEVVDASSLVKTELDKQLLLGNKIAKTVVGGGNALPPDGDSLPATAELSMLIDSATSSGKPGSQASKPTTKSSGSDDSAAPTAVAVDVTAAQPVPTPFLPENPATSAAGLVPRAPIATTGGDGDAANPIADATTSPKREVPTPPPTLTAAAVSAEPQPEIVAPNTVADSTTHTASSPDLSNVSKGATDSAPVIAAEADVAPTVDTLLSRMTGKPRVASTTTAATVASGAPATEVTDDGLSKISALATAATKSAGNTERAEFRDALKQVDSTLVTTAVAPERNENVAATRDTGLRQYIDASAATTARVDVPVGKPGWSDAVSDKVMWMSAQNINSAEIQLNPPDLGPLTVRVSSHHDQTSVYFTSSHAVVRDAVDQSLPRLREMLDGQGIQLLDVGVGDQSGARQQTARGENFSNGGKRGETDDMDGIGEISGVAARSSAMTQRAGLLDAYA